MPSRLGADEVDIDSFWQVLRARGQSQIFTFITPPRTSVNISMRYANKDDTLAESPCARRWIDGAPQRRLLAKTQGLLPLHVAVGGIGRTLQE